MQCLMTIALLCLSDASHVDLSPFALAGRIAEVQIGQASVTVRIASDNLGELDPSKMNRACSERTCIVYHKVCEKTDRTYVCDYSTTNVEFGRWLTLSAPNEAAFRSAEAHLGILDAQTGTPVSLTQFDVISSQPIPFFRHGGRGPQCPSTNGS